MLIKKLINGLKMTIKPFIAINSGTKYCPTTVSIMTGLIPPWLYPNLKFPSVVKYVTLCHNMSLNDEQHQQGSRGSPGRDFYCGPVPSQSRGRKRADLWFTLCRLRPSAAGSITTELSWAESVLNLCTLPWKPCWGVSQALGQVQCCNLTLV